MATDPSAREPHAETGSAGAAAPADPRVARQAEAALRLMAGVSSPRSIQAARRAAAAGASDETVVAPLLEEPVAANELLARGGRALRERLTRAESSRRRAPGGAVKRLLARALVRGSFYLVMLVLVLVILVLLRVHDPDLDIYRLGDRVRALFSGAG